MDKKPYIKYKDCHKIIDNVEHKMCKTCKSWFEMNNNNFVVQPSKRDGFSDKCIVCNNKYKKEYYAKTREHQIALASERQKNNKDKKAIYNKNHYKHEYVRIKHKEQLKQQKESGYHAEYLRKHPEKIKQYAKNHRHHDITNKEWIACKDYFKNEDGEWCCIYCGLTEKEHKQKYKEQLHKDHVDNEGYNDIRNCVPACKNCNSNKWAFPMEEWYKKQDFYNEDNIIKINKWCDGDYKKYIENKPQYKIKRSRVNNEDGTYYMQHELWTVDEKRNLVECVDIAKNKKDLNLDLIIEKGE
ncbi:MAG: HNH endonuclease [Clostridium sp.]|uniref:HNH endonuclease n=1 Tax=Clostridium sp. TaxID=1506 RepID=UPI0025C2FC7F|nr:HNH endonuclease [Clostridium sp.]MCE5220163.1 HNH endonuclease [Clostridium sp.]